MQAFEVVDALSNKKHYTSISFGGAKEMDFSVLPASCCILRFLVNSIVYQVSQLKIVENNLTLKSQICGLHTCIIQMFFGQPYILVCRLQCFKFWLTILCESYLRPSPKIFPYHCCASCKLPRQTTSLAFLIRNTCLFMFSKMEPPSF